MNKGCKQEILRNKKPYDKISMVSTIIYFIKNSNNNKNPLDVNICIYKFDGENGLKECTPR